MQDRDGNVLTSEDSGLGRGTGNVKKRRVEEVETVEKEVGKVRKN